MNKSPKIITDKEASNQSYDFSQKQMRYRTAVRAVVVNEQKISIQHVQKGHNGEFFMLPGGGVDFGESISEALEREVAEEAAAKVTVREQLGTVLEVQYRPNHDLGLVQLNYGFLCDLTEKLEDTALTSGEIFKEMKQVWLDIDEAIEKVGKVNEDDYVNSFTSLRELYYLQRAKQFLK